MFTAWHCTWWLSSKYYVNACLPSIDFQEKRYKEISMAKREELLEAMSKKQINKKRLLIAPLGKEEVKAIADSDDEERKQDFGTKKKDFSTKGEGGCWCPPGNGADPA